jgi:hypothetical protein
MPATVQLLVTSGNRHDHPELLEVGWYVRDFGGYTVFLRVIE